MAVGPRGRVTSAARARTAETMPMLRRVFRGARAAGVLAACALLLGVNETSPPAAQQAPPPGSAPATSGKPILIVPVHGEIDRVQGAFLHRTLRGASDTYAAVFFDIDTPGGRIDTMSKMSDDIIALKVPTIAFISKWAVSAGAFVAMSCDKIYMAPQAQIGAARAVMIGPEGPIALPQPFEEKIASVNRAQFRALAKTKGYPAAIAEAMADETLEVYQVLFDGVKQYLTDEQVADIERDPLKRDKLKRLKVVSPKGRLVSLDANEAVEYDIARGGIAPNLDAVIEKEGLVAAPRVEKEQNWSDKVIAVLTLPQIVGLLILIGFGGVWLELKMPGFGFPGTVAVIAFLLVFGSQFLVGNANALEILIFLVGLAMLAIEVFVTPGFGLLGGAGIACIFLALLLAMQPFTLPDRSAPWQFDMMKVNLTATLGGVAGSLLLLMLFAWLVPGTPIFNRLTLQQKLQTTEEVVSEADEGKSLIGQIGTVVTALRPVGKIEIGDRTFSVVSDAEFIDAGRKARVTRVDGLRIVVEPVQEEPPREPEFPA